MTAEIQEEQEPRVVVTLGHLKKWRACRLYDRRKVLGRRLGVGIARDEDGLDFAGWAALKNKKGTWDVTTGSLMWGLRRAEPRRWGRVQAAALERFLPQVARPALLEVAAVLRSGDWLLENGWPNQRAADAWDTLLEEKKSAQTRIAYGVAYGTNPARDSLLWHLYLSATASLNALGRYLPVLRPGGRSYYRDQEVCNAHCAYDAAYNLVDLREEHKSGDLPNMRELLVAEWHK